ncbi:AGE family epimerase/isomerase [Allonocardiopsis opalescens]|uniref:Mannose/cellobiose epimerase-like protein (N-acyl-D-glucosamine 2-epimerase family) n=1 Tax=Allonocardiopsis opalescens TaxID=1144618 RepID=A0A2T0PZY7_9ACTN|nr:AGE family epimerase/isomerase [Allonocardiopsis opalescens]PRX97094.1 mannose/cellobiose epimerase-like protein (N-acyl-D-glucosamine 2-epimerase family) [Allonocardiopsis opalescens]
MSTEGARLTGRTIAILMESDYVEPELHYYQRRFAEEGAKVEFLTRLWGQPSITFHGHEYQQPFTVDGDLEAVDAERLASFDALIVPSGMVSDRLRYTEDVKELSPAVKLLRDAFARPEVLKGIICHGLWLAAPIPEVVRGRRLTCHNNLIGDARNMGAVYTDQDVVVDGDLVTGRSAGHCHLFARMLIDLVAARTAPRRPALPGPRRPAEAVRSLTADAAPAPVAAPVRAPAPAAVAAPAAAPAPAAPEGAYRPDFTFSDLVAGYVTDYDADRGDLGLRTSDGRTVRARVGPTTTAEFLRNLGHPYVDAGAHLADLLVPGRHVFAHGIYYSEHGGHTFEAKRLVFVGRRVGEYEFADPNWWVDQLKELARFYRRAQFGEGEIDYADYRTVLRLGGDKTDSHVQETDTISRLIYGMSSAYMLTGDEDFLEVAERGTAYLRDHMRFVDRDEDVVYWYHGIEVNGDSERKLFTSEFGDDYDAIPMYEQIYALAGPTQLYRITGDRRIASDIDGTLRLIKRFFRDDDKGGYFSHIDPILLSPHHESLGPNRARKNWNSVGDHAPAYLFNLYLATGDEAHRAMLEECFDLIAEHMPEAGSPFVQERFHADWTPDRSWFWQQNRAVVGHNLKIAWNLMRMMSVTAKDGYRELAERIGRTMPEFGSDRQRGGWYDVVERTRAEGEGVHRFVWHDRKAWWQQEQAILAYQILAGHSGDGEFLRHAREAAAFYNAYFLDHDEGGVFFNVLADGTPYLVGNERFKGSHSMSMYHTAELCFLATVYERLLIDAEPLTLHFKPRPDGFADRTLRVAPDALPAGRVRLEWVEIDGRPYSAFDAAALTVKLPDSEHAVTVRAHLAPVEGGRTRG